MSMLRRIRSCESKVSNNSLSIYLGAVFLFFGLSVLFFDPLSFFNNQVILYGNIGGAPVPFAIFTLVGWTLFANGILSKIKWGNIENKTKLIKLLPLRKKLNVKNLILIFASFLFILLTTMIYNVIRPDERILKRNAEMNLRIKEINELEEQLFKNLEDSSSQKTEEQKASTQ